MSGKSSRRKGHDFERATAVNLRPIWENARRGFQREAESQPPDVEGTPFWIECKKGKRTSIPAALRQAAEATDGRPIMAICKDDRRPATVTICLDDFVEFVKEMMDECRRNC